jgi:hypothetical protein
LKIIIVLVATVLFCFSFLSCTLANAEPMKSFKMRMQDLCRRHLIADDPYQYEEVKYKTLEDLVRTHNDKVAWIELRARLDDPAVSEDEKIEIRSFFNELRNKSE